MADYYGDVVDELSSSVVFGDNVYATVAITSLPSAGAVSCIRVYSGALTNAEAAAIGASPTCAAPPSPAQPVTKKKCKKKKKR